MLEFLKRKKKTVDAVPPSSFTQSPFTEKRRDALEEFPKNAMNRREIERILNALEKPTEKIIRELTPDIEKRTYSLIIGDDASGRIPTFIIGHVLKELYERKELQPPLVRYIAGSSWESSEKKRTAVEEYIGKVKNTMEKTSRSTDKVLIVTDTVAAGRSASVLIGGLAKNGMKADIATMGLLGNEEELSKKLGARIVWGMSNDTPDIYQKSWLSGVEKYPEDLFAKPYEKAIPDEVRAARAVAQEIAHRIAVKYLEGKL